MNIFEHGLSRYLTKKQIKKIGSHKIGIAGAGGLGSNIAVLLARCGFKNFEILDSDTIEPSNLNRQQFFITETGDKKTHTVKQRLSEINPDITVSAHFTRWNNKNARHFFKDCTFILEALDGAEDKLKFVEYYRKKTKYIIASSGMAGFSVSKPLEIKKLGNIYIVGDQSTGVSNNNPPMAPRVTMCAAIMAGITLELALQ